MLIYKATQTDCSDIVNLYSSIHDAEESGILNIGWQRNLYPTEKTAIDAIERGDIFVMQIDKKIVATAIINQKQLDCYSNANWQYNVANNDVMVLHTLAVSPFEAKKGYGAAFVRYYEQYANNHYCLVLRMDTQEKNMNARKLYAKLGYQEVDIITVSDGFNGLLNLNLVLLEKRLS